VGRNRNLVIFGSCVVLVALASAALWRTHNAKFANAALVEFVRTTQARAEQGNAEAQAELGSIYLHGETVEQDDAQAFLWYQKSADQGNANGECGLAWMYSIGRGVQQNYSESLRWYRMAADKGYARGQNGLGYMYSEGFGVPKGDAEAFYWYRKAADQGYAKAEYNVGNMYRYGLGVTQNRDQAARWLGMAAMQGDEYARRAIGLQLTAWRVVLLFVQVIAGCMLTFHTLSLNIWEPNSEVRRPHDWIATATGLFILLTAGLSWYGYQHYMIWCWIYGFTGFNLFKWFLDAVALILLYFVLFPRKRLPTASI
jgi:TPR repeat protein